MNYNFVQCPKCKLMVPRNHMVPVIVNLPNKQRKRVIICKNCVERVKTPRELT